MATWTPGHEWHISAKRIAGTARRLQEAGEEDFARKQMAFALDYELKGLNALLNNDFPDEENIADFYKFAAIYSLESGDPNQATALLCAALKRDVPEKLHRELERLLQDIQTEES
jgi:hypothetical protein